MDDARDSLPASKRMLDVVQKWLTDIGDKNPLTCPEKKLIIAYSKGQPWSPSGRTNTNIIRASLIRFLLIVGDAGNPVQAKGISISNAYIQDDLDLSNCEISQPISIKKSIFKGKLSISNSIINSINLDGSKLKGFEGHLAHVYASIEATRRFRNNDIFDIRGAIIGGNIDLQGATLLSCKGGVCLSANRVHVKGNVYICAVRDQESQIFEKNEGKFQLFKSKGEIRFYGANIESDFILTGADINSINNSIALKIDNSVIKKCLYFYYHPNKNGNEDQNLFSCNGRLIIENSSFSSISDCEKTWISRDNDNDNKNKISYELNGINYKILATGSPTGANHRKIWLKNNKNSEKNNNKSKEQDFYPQPWEQLIKVLREMGHPYEANKIAMAKQDEMFKLGVIGGAPIDAEKCHRRTLQRISRWLTKQMHRLYGKIAGYGYRPMYTVGWMILVWFLCSLVFWCGSNQGYIGPTTPLLNNPELSAKLDASCGHGEQAFTKWEMPRREVPRELYKLVWTYCDAMPAEYTTFQPFIYSADLILPLVDLQQDSDWAPIVESEPGKNIPYGVFMRWLMWFEILFGWAASLILVAVLGRLVEKD